MGGAHGWNLHNRAVRLGNGDPRSPDLGHQLSRCCTGTLLHDRIPSRPDPPMAGSLHRCQRRSLSWLDDGAVDRKYDRSGQPDASDPNSPDLSRRLPQTTDGLSTLAQLASVDLRLEVHVLCYSHPRVWG